jgi:hypothetical protein
MHPEPSAAEAARLSPSRLGVAHRYAAVLVDLHHEAPGAVAREPAQAFRPARDDRVGVGPRLDREAFGELLFKEDVESGLPCARRVDLARLAVSMAPTGSGTPSMWTSARLSACRCASDPNSA